MHDFNHDNQPVVGVSLFEAEAYANWLVVVTSDPFSLPTEEEWERAARHTDGRSYPWGNEWQDGLINGHEINLSRTSAVGAFSQGQAECGAEDMSGNVWEWTDSWYDAAEYGLVLRGGSGNDYQNFALAASRSGSRPIYRVNLVGFRVCRRAPSHRRDP